MCAPTKEAHIDVGVGVDIDVGLGENIDSVLGVAVRVGGEEEAFSREDRVEVAEGVLGDLGAAMGMLATGGSGGEQGGLEVGGGVGRTKKGEVRASYLHHAHADREKADSAIGGGSGVEVLDQASRLGLFRMLAGR